MKVVKCRVTAEIDDEIEVEVEDDATDEDVIKAAEQDWSFVEGEGFKTEILR